MKVYANHDSVPHPEGWFAACLEHMHAHATEIHPGHWHIAVPGKTKVPTTLTVDGEWMVVERALPGYRFTSHTRGSRWLWRLLDRPSAPPSGARAVLPPGETEARVRAEHPILETIYDDPEITSRWLDTARADVAAWTRGARTTATDVVVDDPPATAPIDIPGLCELAGWTATVRSRSGETLVSLPAPDGGVFQALAVLEGGDVKFRVELGLAEDTVTTPASQTAAAVALLRTAGSVRLVRATATCVEGRLIAALEVYLQSPVHVELLNHGLSALALAHRQLAAALAAIAGDDALAVAYLTLQGAR